LVKKDALGDRMKNNYENRTRYYLPRRTYTLMRVDGRSFHSYTKGCARPYDTDLMDAMDYAAQQMCEGIQGARIAFVQSDEITILITDFEDRQTEAWFDGNIQKMASIAASKAAVNFYQCRLMQARKENNLLLTLQQQKPPEFDCRVWTVPDRMEVFNNFHWRQTDATRNSVSMAAQANFSHKQLQGKSSNEMQEMLWQEKGINWSEYPGGFKNGRCIIKQTTIKDVSFIHKATGELMNTEGVERTEWVVVPAPIFTHDRDWLMSYIPEQ
jgi:tRNA(His) guanylyltransferase